MADIAGVIVWRDEYTGETRYATLQNLAGQYCDIAGARAFETLVVGSWTDYDIPLAESPAGGYLYLGSWPEQLVRQVYVLSIYQQVGASPAITDPLLYVGQKMFNGAVLMDWPATAAGYNEIDLTQVNTTETALTSLGGQIRRTHALAGGTIASKDHSAANPTWVHRNEADDADLITDTREVTDETETYTPS